MNVMLPVWFLVTGHPFRAIRQLRNGRRLANASSDSPIQLHLGCGRKKFEGFVNIDAVYTEATDYIANVLSVRCPEQSVSRIESYHVIEHLPHPQVSGLVARLYKMLIPGGVFVAECPDFDEAVRQYLDGNTNRLFNIFGLQRYPGDAHLFGYNGARLVQLLQSAGFVECSVGPGTDSHAEAEPCIRVEARRPLK